MPYGTGVAMILSTSPQFPKKIGLFLCLWGCTLCLRVHLQLSPRKFGPERIFSPPWGCTCTQCTPWLRLCNTVFISVVLVIYNGSSFAMIIIIINEYD